MGVRLEVTIAGLFLIVDDRANDLTHVIAPLTDAHGHGHAGPDHHTSWIVGERGFKRVKIDGYRLDFRKHASPPPICDIGAADAISLADCTTGSLPKFPTADLNTAAWSGKTSTHIILPGGTLLGERHSCIINAKGTRVSVATVVRWVVELNGDDRAITLPDLIPLKPGKKPVKLSVPPLNDQSKPAWLGFCSVPTTTTVSHPGELYGPVGRLDPSHFTAFASFFPSSPKFSLTECPGTVGIYTPETTLPPGGKTFPVTCPCAWVST